MNEQDTNSHIDALRYRIAALESERKKLCEILDETADRYKAALATISADNQRIDTLEAELTAYKSLSTKLAVELTTAQVTAAALEAEKVEMKRQLAELQRDFDLSAVRTLSRIATVLGLPADAEPKKVTEEAKRRILCEGPDCEGCRDSTEVYEKRLKDRSCSRPNRSRSWRD